MSELDENGKPIEVPPPVEKKPEPPPKKVVDDEARRTADAELKAKLSAADSKIQSLEESITELKQDAAKGKGSPELERQVADMKKTLENEIKKREFAEDRANRKTIDADVRAMLDGQVLDVDLVMKVLRQDLRVDADGKVAIRLEEDKDEWGSLTRETLMKRVPDLLKPARGVPGTGARGPRTEIRANDGSLVDRGMASQSEWNKNEKEILMQLKGGVAR